VKQEIVQFFGTPAGRIDIIYNGLPPLDIPPNARREVRAELGLTEADYVALFVGSGWERKGLRYAIEAVRQTPGVILLVAGRGKTSGLLSGERVRFLGPRNDVPRLLAAADVFILPTLYDPFSNASLEALAAGLPVITTEANGFAEIIQSGIETVPSPGSIEGLSAALQRWSDLNRRAAIRPQLLALGARYTIEENVRQTLEVIEQGKAFQCDS
jgi:UDP-glucose:(heptosyl)LPS alpha-1,3-glucosyltransferase